jgi:hypothetical protein
MPRRKAHGLTIESDPLRRGLRSLVQIGFVQAAMQLYNAFATTPLTPNQMVAITTFVTPILIVAYNWLEDAPGVPLPALLKAPASGGEHPVPDPEGGSS